MTERKPLKIFVVESKQPEINLLALSTYEQRQDYRAALIKADGTDD